LSAVAEPLEPRPLAIPRADGRSLAGEEVGPADGPTIVMLHGLTATRRYVVHGSRTLPREGIRMLSYDARGHGESDPAGPGAGYAYDELVRDLGEVLGGAVGEGRALVAGHSMGAHTIAGLALQDRDHLAALVLIGPTVTGAPPSDEVLAYWDRLAAGMESEGVEGFVRAYDRDLDPQWRDTLLRITRDRLSAHRHPDAVARALREVPRSLPFHDLSELERLDLPALVVASHDEADPGHPFATAQEWAERLPRARLVSEEPGQSPLAWQGGRLSREIAAFCGESQVRERLGA
jgi:pimeloyl-ACP methyl ester carboxylesterase